MKHTRYVGLVGNQLVVVAVKVGPQSTMMAPAGELHGVSVDRFFSTQKMLGSRKSGLWMLMAEIRLTRC